MHTHFGGANGSFGVACKQYGKPAYAKRETSTRESVLKHLLAVTSVTTSFARPARTKCFVGSGLSHFASTARKKDKEERRKAVLRSVTLNSQVFCVDVTLIIREPM